mgnify:CR=1 FL=1
MKPGSAYATVSAVNDTLLGGSPSHPERLQYETDTKAAGFDTLFSTHTLELTLLMIVFNT